MIGYKRISGSKNGIFFFFTSLICIVKEEKLNKPLRFTAENSDCLQLSSRKDSIVVINALKITGQLEEWNLA